MVMEAFRLEVGGVDYSVGLEEGRQLRVTIHSDDGQVRLGQGHRRTFLIYGTLGWVTI